MEPAERKLAGRWHDIHLTRDQVNNVETYLTCFAPWVLSLAEREGGLTDV
jgi:hypothetical protein